MTGDCHLLVERAAGEGDALAPADLNTAAVGGGVERLRRVEVAVPDAVLARFDLEFPAVERAEDVRTVGRVQYPARILLARDGELEQVGTLEEALDPAGERPRF